jgi:hypothetical protein
MAMVQIFVTLSKLLDVPALSFLIGSMEMIKIGL